MNLQETSSCFKGSSATTLYHHVKVALRSAEKTNLTEERDIFVHVHPEYRHHVLWTCTFAERATEENAVLVLSI